MNKGPSKWMWTAALLGTAVLLFIGWSMLRGDDGKPSRVPETPPKGSEPSESPEQALPRRVVAVSAAPTVDARIRDVSATDPSAWRGILAAEGGPIRESMMLAASGKEIATAKTPAGAEAIEGAMMRMEHGLPSDVAAVFFASVYRDREMSAVSRDYALQHLRAAWIAQVEKDPTWSVSAAAQGTAAAWTEAVAETDGTLAGTALLAMEDMARRNLAGLTSGHVGALAAGVATNAATADFSRITALQVCGLCQATQALEAARGFARGDATGSFSLRLSAVAAVGLMGDGSDESWLRGLVEDGKDPRLKPACELALMRISGRREGGVSR